MHRIAIMIASIAVLLGGSAAAQEARSEIGLQRYRLLYHGHDGPRYHSTKHEYRRLSCRLPVFFQPLAGSRRRLRLRPEHSRVFCSCRIRESSGQYSSGDRRLCLPRTGARAFRFSPYLLAEGGALIFDPTGNAFASVAAAQRQATGVFAYGGGADFPLFRHVALRAEFRGLVYRAPNFGLATLNTNAITHKAEPSAGIVFRF